MTGDLKFVSFVCRVQRVASGRRRLRGRPQPELGIRWLRVGRPPAPRGSGGSGPGAGRAGRAPGRVVCSIARLHERGRMRGSPRDTAEGYDKHKTIDIFHYSIFMGNVNPTINLFLFVPAECRGML